MLSPGASVVSTMRTREFSSGSNYAGQRVSARQRVRGGKVDVLLMSAAGTLDLHQDFGKPGLPHVSEAFDSARRDKDGGMGWNRHRGGWPSLVPDLKQSGAGSEQHIVVGVMV